ncbi:hypothetical protein B0A49_10533 [Cryomyces minteri]|uniref:Uncharacterized protein n=1 Tax=Cryomyces minteri TaxID=331657 RepID=A0A4U0WQ56_9PEZI|nr:hypothetical protein B0A49_10533 [Cryomyces minteri]
MQDTAQYGKLRVRTAGLEQAASDQEDEREEGLGGAAIPPPSSLSGAVDSTLDDLQLMGTQQARPDCRAQIDWDTDAMERRQARIVLAASIRGLASPARECACSLLSHGQSEVIRQATENGLRPVIEGGRRLRIASMHEVRGRASRAIGHLDELIPDGALVATSLDVHLVRHLRSANLKAR